MEEAILGEKRRRMVPAPRDASIETEDEHRRAVLEIELEVATGGDADIGLAADLEAHRRGVDASTRLERPERLAGLRVVGREGAVALAGEDEIAFGGKRAADHRLIGLHLPGDLAGVD